MQTFIREAHSFRETGMSQGHRHIQHTNNQGFAHSKLFPQSSMKLLLCELREVNNKVLTSMVPGRMLGSIGMALVIYLAELQPFMRNDKNKGRKLFLRPDSPFRYG